MMTGLGSAWERWGAENGPSSGPAAAAIPMLRRPSLREGRLARVADLLSSGPEELAAHRRAEQEKSALLERIESTFSRSSPRRLIAPD